MIYYTGRIKIDNPVRLFGQYEVTKKDQKRYTDLINSGQEDQAIDEFVEKYLIDYIELYNNSMNRYLRYFEQGEVKTKDQNKIMRNVILLSGTVSVLMTKNMRNFIRDVYAPYIFKLHNITDIKLKRSILQETLKQFESLTKSAMSNTQNNILNHIRQMQRSMIVENQKIRKLKIIENALEREIITFKRSLRVKFPDYYKALENGQILKSRSYGVPPKVRNYKLDSYTEMATRNTLLNVDRTSVEVKAGETNNDIVEYYQRDFRRLKTGIERNICIDILNKKIFGKSLLALTQSASSKYGIQTLDSAKRQNAMGINCRHSIRMLSERFKKRLRKAA